MSLRSGSKGTAMSLVPVAEAAALAAKTDLKNIPKREKGLLLASKGADLAVIREAQADDRPSTLLAPTMKIHRKKPQELHAMDFHPDGETVMGAGGDGILEVHHVFGHCEEVATIRVSKQPLRAAGYLPKGNQVFVGTEAGHASIWDLAHGSVVRQFGSNHGEGRYHTDGIRDMKVDKEGDLMMSVDKAGTALVWDLRTSKSVQRINLGRTGQRTGILACDWGRGAKTAFLGTDRGQLIMYDLRKGLAGDGGPIEQFGRDHEIDESFQNESTSQLGLELKRELGVGGKMGGLAQSLKRGGKNTSAPMVNIVGKGRVYNTERAPGNPRMTGVAVNPHGDMVATFSDDNKVRIFRTDYCTEGARLVTELPYGPCTNFEHPNLKLAWRPDGKWLAVGSADKQCYVYKNMDRFHVANYATGPYGMVEDPGMKSLIKASCKPTLAHVLEGHISSVTDVAWHPKQSIIGSVGSDGQIILGELDL